MVFLSGKIPSSKISMMTGAGATLIFVGHLHISIHVWVLLEESYTCEDGNFFPHVWLLKKCLQQCRKEHFSVHVPVDSVWANSHATNLTGMKKIWQVCKYDIVWYVLHVCIHYIALVQNPHDLMSPRDLAMFPNNLSHNLFAKRHWCWFL